MSEIGINIQPTKDKWKAYIMLIVFFQFTFYLFIGFTFYALITLNFETILMLGTIVLIQRVFSRSNRFINFVNDNIKPLYYFRNFTRIYEQKIEESEKSLFCFHPHSVFIYGMLANMNADNSKMSKLIGLASRFILNTPFTGTQLRLWGLQSVNKGNLVRLMKAQKDLGIVPGGFEEATLTTPDEFRIYIEHRKGFVKYALSYGYAIHPVLIYNQHKAFNTFKPFLKLRLFFNKLKIPGVLFWGRYLLFFPTNVDMITIVGKAIKREINRTGQVSDEEINQKHEEYINQIKRLHQKYKNQYKEAPIKIY